MKNYLRIIMLFSALFPSTPTAAAENDSLFTEKYRVNIPDGYIVHLHKAPQNMKGEAEDEINPVVSLTKGTEIMVNSPTKLSEIADDCKEQKKVVYPWIRTQDWACVKAASGNQRGTVGWLNKMLIIKLTSP